MINLGLDVGSTTAKIVALRNGHEIIFSDYKRHNAKVYDAVIPNLQEIFAEFGEQDVTMHITGSAGMGISEKIQIPFIQEVVSETEYAKKFHKDVNVIVDIGGEDSKMIFLSPDRVPDIRMNGSCAGGTGAFIDQMASLMNLKHSELNDLAKKSTKKYNVASRCGVFAKTDVQNLLSRNIPHSDIAASIFHAVSIQVINTLARGNDIKPKILLLGGPLTFLDELVKIFLENLNFTEKDVEKISYGQYFPALGAAVSKKSKVYKLSELIEKFSKAKNIKTKKKNSLNSLFKDEKEFHAWEKTRFTEKIQKISIENYEGKNLFLGIDSGSTTTKIVFLGEKNEIVFSYYAQNNGDPIGTIVTGLSKFVAELKKYHKEVNIIKSAATGYGEDLIKAAFGLDIGIVETIAHYTGAKFFQPNVSFILDIGGQDMKAIFIRNNAITRIELNESCSSGCGSFIDTFSQSLGYPVVKFAEMACTAKVPSDLGIRCTVFMNSKVKEALRENAEISEISAGLAISVIKNSLFKVLKLRDFSELGDNIVLQGGTFKNPAVHRAFEKLTGKQTICSTIPELMGAFGASLFAKFVYENGNKESSFVGLSGLDIDNSYTTKELHCKGCNNFCTITKFNFDNGNTFYSGNKCEKIFSNKGESSQKGESIIAYKLQQIFDRKSNEKGLRIGIPRVLNVYENYPFWHTLFTELGFSVVISDESNAELYNKSLGTIMSDNVCMPAKLVHGHILNLIDKKVDRIFYPKVVFEKMEYQDAENSYNCPVVSGYPDVIENAINPYKNYHIPYDKPAFSFKNDKLLAKKCLSYFKKLGISERNFKPAFKKAIKEQNKFKQNIRQKALEIIEKSKKNKQVLIVLAGRPYHADSFINQKMPEVITALGANIITEDTVPISSESNFKNLQVLTQWSYPNRIYNVAKWVANQDNLVQMIQINSFGCGPDAITIDEANSILNTKGKNNNAIRVDEITSTGSIKLRVRSLLEALKFQTDNIFRPRTDTASFEKVDKKRTILAPYFSEYYSYFLPAIFKIMGYNLKILPKPDRSSVDYGLKFANNEICYPAIIIVGDVIKAMKEGNYNRDEIAVGITQTGGQCRASTYLSLIKKALVAAGYDDIPVIAVGTAGKIINSQPGFKIDYKKILPITFSAMLYADSISKLYFSTIIREKNKGDTQNLVNKYLEKSIRLIEKNEPKLLIDSLENAVEEFNNIPTKDIKTRKIGIVGEIYVKYNPFANGFITDWLIKEGIEVVVPPLFEFFIQEFINYDVNKKANLIKRNIFDFLMPFFENIVEKKIKIVNSILRKFKYSEPYYELRSAAEKAKNILCLVDQFGEGWLIAAEVAKFSDSGINNVVSVQPFGCIANHIISKGIEKKVKELFPKMNMLFLDYDADTTEVNVLNRLYFMVKNTKDENKEIVND